MTMLTIIQNACDRMSLPRPSVVVGSTDQQVRQLLGLLNEAGYQLASAMDWQALREEDLFLSTGTPDQANALPDDLDHFISNSFFNRSTRRQIIGPITPQQWQAIQAQPQLNRVYLAFVQRSGKFLVTPTPPADQVIAYEYISKNWAKSAEGAPQSMYLADSDLTFLDEELLTLSLRWRFQQAKGLDYAESMKTYSNQLEQQSARDGGNTELSSTGSDSYILSANLPQGNFPGPGF